MCCSQQPSPHLRPLATPATNRQAPGSAGSQKPHMQLHGHFLCCLPLVCPQGQAGDPTRCQQLAPAWAPRSSAQPRARIVISSTSGTPQAPRRRRRRGQVLLGTIHSSGTTNIFMGRSHMYTPSKQPRHLGVSITKSSQHHHTSGGFLLYRKIYK